MASFVVYYMFELITCYLCIPCVDMRTKRLQYIIVQCWGIAYATKLLQGMSMIYIILSREKEEGKNPYGCNYYQIVTQFYVVEQSYG